MGRDQTSHSVPISRADRSKLARETINKTIPRLLTAYPRAKAGIANVQLIRDLPPTASSVKGLENPTIRILNSDTLDAARALHLSHPNHRVAVLSMASPLRPGGGVLTGATSQEESLCMRTTLYPSLRDEFYRLPENAIIYTPDVLVFQLQTSDSLPKSDRFFVDVISCAAIRLPEVSEGRYVEDSDREVMVKKMRLIMRAAVKKGCKQVVLAALGCGAYANPVREVAEMFKRVICGKSGRAREEGWPGIEEIVFAIRDTGSTISTFQEVFQDVAEPAAQVEARRSSIQ